MFEVGGAFGVGKCKAVQIAVDLLIVKVKRRFTEVQYQSRYRPGVVVKGAFRI